MIMGRKGQIHAIREIFQFGLGIVLLSSIMYMFYNSLIPTVADYALALEADNINSHINYLLMNLIGLVNEGVISGSISLEYAMPSSIGDYEYTSYFSSNNVCTLVNELTLVQCLEISTEEVSTEGVYLSGGELKVTITKTPVSMSILMTN
jgi:hypothetical protein